MRCIYDIDPNTKPRMTHRDVWKKRPNVLKYRAFCDEVRLRGVQLPSEGAAVTFVLPMPASWSGAKRARMNGAPHTARPDLSNLLKALEDATWGEDSVIHHYAGLRKRWGEKGQIIIEEERVDG